MNENSLPQQQQYEKQKKPPQKTGTAFLPME